ncbi:MAG: ylyB [Chlamydiales bacterium]|jgi:23S rRNA pseudouridine1911/1915/1917 synthase|nr:ylyB [Chlamydiales bacterium]
MTFEREAERLDLDTLFIQPEEEKLRLDQCLKQRFPMHSRTYFQYLIQKGLVLLNGQIAKKRELVHTGDEVEVEFALTEALSLEPEPIPLNIIYEDADILVIDKPAGLIVHPAPGHPNHTFVNALIYHCQSQSLGLEEDMGTLRPGIVHRLDKDTSGLLVAAKNLAAQQNLVAAFAERSVKKEYVAICHASTFAEAFLKTPIGRHPRQRQMMAVLEEGKEAISHFYPLAQGRELAFVKAEILTGRTHQIRVHLKHLQKPVLGDALYGHLSINKKYGVERQLLHAYRLQFPHPRTGEWIDLTAPLPQDMQKVLQGHFLPFSFP